MTQAVEAQLRAIFQIGTKVYPTSSERLLVHQMGGDGLAVVSEASEHSLERPIAIAVALMRHITTAGVFASAAIGEGDFAHIGGWHPKELEINDCGRILLGEGLMTLSTSVMGTALLRAYELDSACPSGPFLMISENDRDRIPDGLDVRETTSKNTLSINWLQTELAELSTICQKTDIDLHSAETIRQKMKDYCSQNIDIGDKWRDPLLELLDIQV